MNAAILELAYEAAKTALPHEALQEIAPGELERVVMAVLSVATEAAWKADWERIAFNLCSEFGSDFVADKQPFAKAVVREYLQSLSPDKAEDRPVAPSYIPAFPQNEFCFADPDREGMSLRDWFAGQALAGFMAYAGDEDRGSHHNNNSPDGVAVSVYALADALLAARAAI